MQTVVFRSAFGLFKGYVYVERVVIRKRNEEERLSSSESIQYRIAKIIVEHMVYCLGICSGASAVESVGTARMVTAEVVACKRRSKSVEHSLAR